MLTLLLRRTEMMTYYTKSRVEWLCRLLCLRRTPRASVPTTWFLSYCAVASDWALRESWDVLVVDVGEPSARDPGASDACLVAVCPSVAWVGASELR